MDKIQGEGIGATDLSRGPVVAVGALADVRADNCGPVADSWQEKHYDIFCRSLIAISQKINKS